MPAGDLQVNIKIYCFVTAGVFSATGLLHLVRIVLGWEAVIGGWFVPIWLSWLAPVVMAALAFVGFYYGRKST